MKVKKKMEGSGFEPGSSHGSAIQPHHNIAWNVVVNKTNIYLMQYTNYI